MLYIKLIYYQNAFKNIIQSFIYHIQKHIYAGAQNFSFQNLSWFIMLFYHFYTIIYIFILFEFKFLKFKFKNGIS